MTAKLVPVDPQTQIVATTRRTRAEHISAWAEAVEVTAQNLEVVSSALTDIMRESKAVDAELKAITKPQNDALKAVRAFFAPATNAYAKAESVLKTKIGIARNAQIVLNQQATQAAQVRLAAGDARGAALAANVIENTALPSNLSIREEWGFVITDPDQVPRELCQPDVTKIRAFVHAWGDKHPIPGVTISKVNRVTVRTA